MTFQKDILNLLICLFFSILLTSINWEDVQGQNFVDKSQSLIVLSEKTYDLKLDFTFESIIFNLSNEQLWNQGVRYLYFDLDIELLSIFNFISFLSSFVFSTFILKYSKPIFLFLLLNPIIIDLFFSQFRFSLTISLFLLSIMLFDKNKWLSIFLWVLILFIHTTSILFIIIFIFERYYLKNINYKTVILSILFGLIVSLLLGPFRNIILSLINDRRINYQIGSNNFLFSFFWIFYCFVFIKFSNFKITNKSNVIILLILLSIFSFNIMLNVYSVRFLAVALPFFIISIRNLNKEIRMSIISIYIFYDLFQWFYWVK